LLIFIILLFYPFFPSHFFQYMSFMVIQHQFFTRVYLFIFTFLSDITPRIISLLDKLHTTLKNKQKLHSSIFLYSVHRTLCWFPGLSCLGSQIYSLYSFDGYPNNTLASPLAKSFWEKYIKSKISLSMAVYCFLF
jgi:hypothetical protein